MAEFDLAAVLGEAAARDTGSGNRERIEYIPYQQIMRDQANFYSLDGIDELAANIELVGLQQPIRVAKVPGSGRFHDRYRVVSGHRRLAAWHQLDIGCPEETYRNIPAIVEPDRDEPDALRQLRLIYANSDTRKMTGRDLQQQADRIRALLTELKENGYEFKGRMRDQVAKICGVSKSKLSRLDAIKNNLHAGIYNAYYQTTEISETAAYEISKLPMKEQSEICRKLSKGWRPTTEKILQYISDRAEAKKEAERDAAADLKAIQDTIRREYDHLTAAEEPEEPEDLPEEDERELNLRDVPIMGTDPVVRYFRLFSPKTELPQWQKDAPPHDGRYLCLVDLGINKLHEQRCDFDGGQWKAYGRPVDDMFTVKAWWPLPGEYYGADI